MTHPAAGRPPDRPAARVVAVLLAAVLLAAGCSGGETVEPGAGYVSGDGSVTTWPTGTRPGPVAVGGTTFDGQRVDTASWRGRVVVLNFWYAACPPCRAEAPDLAAAAREHPDVTFLGINATDDAATARAFDRAFDMPYASLADDDGRATASLAGIVSLRAVPTTLVLDTQGRVAARVLGRAARSTLEGLLADADPGATPTASGGPADRDATPTASSGPGGRDLTPTASGAGS